MKIPKTVIYIILAVIALCVAIYLAFFVVDGMTYLMDWLGIQNPDKPLNTNDIQSFFN